MTDLTASSLRALKLMDLTTLNDDDTNEKVIALCHQAKTPVGNTAAICIYPRFIPIARKTLKEQGTPDIRIATVTNFPHGNDDIEIALAETRAAIAYGADEVDVVFPYRALIAGNEQIGFDLVKACKDACAAANVLLKVIIETGELKEEALIRKASEISIKAGADFIKTSTGKVPVNATPESARFGKLLCQRQDLRQIILIQTFFLIIDSQILQKLIAFIHGIQKRQINRKDRRFQFFRGFSGEIVLYPFF